MISRPGAAIPCGSRCFRTHHERDIQAVLSGDPLIPGRARSEMGSGLGLVLSGGFLRNAFQVGVIEELGARGFRFDVVVGVSSGAWNAACVATDQVNEMRSFWMRVAEARKLRLANLWRYGTPSNFQEIVTRVPARSLRFDRLEASPVRLLIGATRVRHRRLHLFEHWRSRREFLATLMASNYVPGLYGRPVRIDGRYYADGGFADNVPYEAAFEAGCRHAVVVLTDPRGRFRKRLCDRTVHRIPPAFRDRITLVHPGVPLPVGRLRATAEGMRACFEIGRKAVGEAFAR
ncbi:MAG: patatin-like phospholipase family protein [Deltaproteobacteria bacterium]|nr:patatin-like phospholipase family protein [Deltaproteobacteria bacterium]